MEYQLLTYIKNVNSFLSTFRWIFNRKKYLIILKASKDEQFFF